MYSKIVEYLKDKSLLLAMIVILLVILLDNKSYVYIGPSDFRIEKRPRSAFEVDDSTNPTSDSNVTGLKGGVNGFTNSDYAEKFGL